MPIIQPKFKKHSEHLGFTIFKRLPNSGTHGGAWMVDSTLCRTLAQARAFVERYRPAPAPDPTTPFTVSLRDSEGVLLREEQFDTISDAERFCASSDDDETNIDIIHPDGSIHGWS